MQHEARGSGPGLISRIFSRPSSALGRAAAASMAGSIGLVILLNLTAEQGSDDVSGPQRVIFAGLVLCLFASGVLGLIAVFRRRERSWVVLLPAVLICAAIANELVQGLLQLVGIGGGD
jgi:hypothetical protein